MSDRPTGGPHGAVETADVAAHANLTEHGPTPLRRALLGLTVGAGAGMLAALLTPRPARARRRSDLRIP